jgi:predicted site-specific integrase-resolvase
MKLSEYAKANSISYQTAWRHLKLGLIEGARQLPSGTVVIDENPTIVKDEYTVIYTRVSSSENRDNLDAQAERLAHFCEVRGIVVNEVVKECASGLNDERPKLSKVFVNRRATRVVVEHKDRLTRFGFNYIKLLYPECEFLIVNQAEDKQDLFEDFVSIVTSFCARIYGRRRSRRQTEQLLNGVEADHQAGDDQ